MTKAELIRELQLHHRDFTDLLQTFDEQTFGFAPEGKWSAGMQLDHLIRSVAPVGLAFRLPWLARLVFGKANRPSRSYESVVEKYKSKLAAGGRASGAFVPKVVAFRERQALCQKLQREVEQLCRSVEKTPEHRLNTLILPHPLLGKLTFREMLCFTIYHVQHHRASVAGMVGSN
jgi:hypothetical protein